MANQKLNTSSRKGSWRFLFRKTQPRAETELLPEQDSAMLAGTTSEQANSPPNEVIAAEPPPTESPPEVEATESPPAATESPPEEQSNAPPKEIPAAESPPETTDTNGRMPTSEQLQTELARVEHNKRFGRTFRSTIYTLVVVAAVAVLIAVLVMPVLWIYGSSMNPTLTEGDIVLSVKTSDFKQGDLVCFYYGNKLLVKRCIATAGQWVEIDEDGNVYVDGERLVEPYVNELSYGECDIEYPYQVPDGRIFVLGDHRATSVDSRSSSVGCVADEQVVGKIVFRVWPLSGFGTVT